MRSILQVFIFDILSKILVGITSLMLIRYMPQTEYAGFTLAQSFFMMATGVIALAFNKIYIVGYQRFNLSQSAQPLLGLQLTALLFFTLLTLPFIRFAQGLYWMIILLMFSSCVSEFTKTFFQQELKFVKFSLVEITRSGLFFLGVCGLIFYLQFHIKAWQALAIQSIAMLAVFFIVFRKWIDPVKLFNLTDIYRLAKQILQGPYCYLLGYFVFLALMSQIDVFMLKSRSTEYQLATYGSASRYYNLLILALNAVHAVFLPVLQKIQTRDEMDTFFRQQRHLLYIFIPVALLGGWLSQWLIPFIDMGKYPGAVTTFRILVVSSIISLALSPYASLVIRFEDFKFLLILSCMMLPLAVVLNSFLSPRYGAIGAAISNLSTYGILNTAIFFRANSRLKKVFGSNKHAAKAEST